MKYAEVRPEDIPNLRLVRQFEGGRVSAGELNGRSYLVIDEGTLADFLDLERSLTSGNRLGKEAES